MTVDGRAVDVDALGSRVARRLVAVLAVEGRPVSRDAVADAVWDGAPPKTWETALRGAVHKLRRAAGAEVVRTRPGAYELEPAIEVDVRAAVAAIDQAEAALRAGEVEAALEGARLAAAVLDQPLLAAEDGEWFEQHRAWAASHAMRALLVTSTAATAAGEHGLAVRSATDAVGRNPFLEAAHRRLMAAHAAAGQRAEALIAYRRCRELLAEELGTGPSAETDAVYADLLREPAAAVVVPVGLPDDLDTALACVGREAALAALWSNWDAAQAGDGVACAVLGPAGIGKSRCVAELASRAHAAGAAVVHGRFDPDGFGAFTALTAALAQLGVVWPAPAGGSAMPGEMLRSALVAELLAALRSAAEERPLVIVLDDVHWADRSSVAVVAAALSGGLPPRCLLLVTARDDVPNVPVDEVLRKLAQVRLEALDVEAVGELARNWSGGVPDASVAWLHERSGGNPFFLVTLLQRVTGVPGAELPSDRLRQAFAEASAGTLAAEIGGVIDHIPRGRAILGAAAVIGSEFRIDLLVAVVDLRPTDVATALDHAVRARLLGQAHGDQGRFHFTHALVRETIAASIADDERRALHASVAAAVQASGLPPADIVRHMLASEDPRAVLSAARRAVEDAVELWEWGAPDAAADLLDRVGAHLDGQPAERSREAAAIHACQAAVRRTLNDVDGGRAHLRRAVRTALELRAPDVLWPLRNGLQNPLIGTADDEVIDGLERLRALAPAGSRTEAIVLCLLNAELAWRDAERATAAARRAMEIAEARGDVELFAAAAHAWSRNGCSVLPPAERVPVLERTLAAEAGRIQRRAGLVTVFDLIGAVLELGDRQRVVELAARVVEATGGIDYPELDGFVARLDGVLACMDGDWDALARSDARLQRPDSTFAPRVVMLVGAGHDLARRYHCGGLAEVVDLLDAIAGAAADVPIVACLHALVDALVGRPSAASRLDAAVAAVDSHHDQSWVGSVAAATEAAALLGDRRAVALADRLAPFAGSHVVAIWVAYYGAVDRVRGLAAVSAGRMEEGVALLEDALAQHRRVPSPPYIARTAAELALALRLRGRPGDQAWAEALDAEAGSIRAAYGLAAPPALRPA